MVEYENGSPGPRDCVNRAEWTLHDAQGPPYIPHFRRHASTSLSLPRSSSLLYFLSRGSLSHGRIEIDNDGEEADKVSVEVGIWYNADDVLDRVDVCTLQRAEGKNGVGIFVSFDLSSVHVIRSDSCLPSPRVRSIIVIPVMSTGHTLRSRSGFLPVPNWNITMNSRRICRFLLIRLVTSKAMFSSAPSR